jgi:hypothetical protein
MAMDEDEDRRKISSGLAEKKNEEHDWFDSFKKLGDFFRDRAALFKQLPTV